ncbi:MAG: type II secretion system F family protein [Lautropia sp.]|nr:type II secretion system F family protein [Lautropia sp.]
MNLSALLPFIAVGALVLAVWLFALGGAGLASEVPEPPDREHKDPQPRYWQLLGWFGHAVSHWVRPFISPMTRRRLQEQLRRAGLEFALTVEQFVAGQVIAGMLSVLALVVACLPKGFPGLGWCFLALVGGAMLPVSWLRDRTAKRVRQITRSLPFYLDVITLAIEAGSNMTGAFQHAAEKGPDGPMADELNRVLRDIRAGRTRAEAMRAMAERLRISAVSNWIAAILSAEKQGSSLGPILRAQADQRRNERFMQAEAMALKAPVKMLFPLMTCIFPCTFIIVFFPIGVRIMEGGFF